MNYQKEINRIVDVVTKLDCLNLSIGANNKEEFLWINDNYEFFKKEYIEAYNQIINIYKKEEKINVFFIVEQKKDSDFTAVERHLGIWNKHKEIPLDFKSETIYLKNNYRFGYAKIENLRLEHIPFLANKVIVFSKDELSLVEAIKNHFNDVDVFKYLYNNRYMVLTFRDFACEGNALVFYAKEKEKLDKIFNLAEKYDFKKL